MYKKSIVSISIIVFSWTVWAQKKNATPPSPAARELTLSEAISHGLQTSPELLKASSMKNEASAQFSQYKGALFPKVTLRGEARISKDSAAWSTTATDTNSQKRYTAAADIEQPLFTGGALLGGLRLGRALEDAAEQTYYITRQSVVRKIVRAFYDLAEAHDTLVAAQENLSILESYSKITKRYESIGRTRQIDRMQADVNFTLGRFDILDAQNLRTEAEASLKNVLSLEGEKSITPKFNITVQPLAKITVEEALETAEKNNPELRNLRVELDAVKARNQIDLAEDLPKLSLEGSAGYQSPDRSAIFENNADFYTFGLVLRVPLFSGLSSLSKRQAHKEEFYQAERNLQIKRKELREKLEVALSNAGRLYSQLLEVQDVVKQTRRALELANQGYSRGIVSPSDVLQFQRSRYDAEKRFIATRYNYLRAVLDVRELLGTDLERVYAQ